MWRKMAVYLLIKYFSVQTVNSTTYYAPCKCTLNTDSFLPSAEVKTLKNVYFMLVVTHRARLETLPFLLNRD